jgi:hypothetical protein
VRRRKTLLAAIIALLTVAAGCAGSDAEERTVPPSQLRFLVLQPTDLPRVFTRFDEGPVRIADTPPGPRGDPARFGREGGWIARYRRHGSATTEGPLVVESRVDLFEDEGGAQEEFDAYREELEGQLGIGGRRLEPSDLGAEAFGISSGGGASNTVRFFRVVWRDENVAASLNLNGFRGLRLSHVLDLARKQQQRIERAFATEARS